MQSALQVWAGLFYLLNKIFFSRAERSEGPKKRLWRIWSWSVYLVGLPAWLAIFAIEHNWIIGAVEASGAISMALGLVIAIRGIGQEPKWLRTIARIVIVIGIACSFYEFGGLTKFTQALELGVAVGFLVGTYLLAREHPTGYLWFMFMLASAGTLMGVQGYPWLTVQQIVSLGFIVDAYLMQRRRTKLQPITPRAV